MQVALSDGPLADWSFQVDTQVRIGPHEYWPTLEEAPWPDLDSARSLQALAAALRSERALKVPRPLGVRGQTLGQATRPVAELGDFLQELWSDPVVLGEVRQLLEVLDDRRRKTTHALEKEREKYGVGASDQWDLYLAAMEEAKLRDRRIDELQKKATERESKLK